MPPVTGRTRRDIPQPLHSRYCLSGIFAAARDCWRFNRRRSGWVGTRTPRHNAGARDAATVVPTPSWTPSRHESAPIPPESLISPPCGAVWVTSLRERLNSVLALLPGYEVLRVRQQLTRHRTAMSRQNPPRHWPRCSASRSASRSASQLPHLLHHHRPRNPLPPRRELPAGYLTG